MPVEIRIEPLGEHRDLIAQTVDWHMAAFDQSGDRGFWLKARTEEARLGGLPCCWVAFFDDEPVGSVSLIASNMDTRPELTPWLAALFVLPESRDLGVGRALVRHCEAEAYGSGCDQLYLYTSEARGFYDRLGWVPTSEESYEDQLVTVMTRALRTGPASASSPRST